MVDYVHQASDKNLFGVQVFYLIIFRGFIIGIRVGWCLVVYGNIGLMSKKGEMLIV